MAAVAMDGAITAAGGIITAGAEAVATTMVGGIIAIIGDFNLDLFQEAAHWRPPAFPVRHGRLGTKATSLHRTIQKLLEPEVSSTTELREGDDTATKRLVSSRARAMARSDPKRKPDQTNLYSFAAGRYLRIMTCSVLLDLDGTLIDSQPGILASCHAALRALGHEPDETLDISRTIGPPLEDMMQILLRSFGDDRVDEAVAAYRQHYGESGFLGSVPYAGIGKSLEEMKRTGLRLYLATSKRAVFASRILDHLKFAAYFDGIYGSVPGGELDHKPELLAHILSRHGLSPSHSLMVGDRRYDISGAHAVGIRGLGALWGYGTRDELETAGADRLVDCPGDLARTVLSMVNGKESPR